MIRMEVSMEYKKIIDDRAVRVLNAYGYSPKKDCYVDAIKLCRFFGFKVKQSNNLDAFDDGTVSVSPKSSEKSILINSDRSFETKRFIAAHELSHYLLHYTKSSGVFKHRESIKGKDLEENDADYMAACLLMPESAFREQYKLAVAKGDLDIVSTLQSVFLTPEESIVRRIQEVCQMETV